MGISAQTLVLWVVTLCSSEVDTTTAEEYSAFTFTYSELYPPEDEDSKFFKNNLNQKNN